MAVAPTNNPPSPIKQQQYFASTSSPNNKPQLQQKDIKRVSQYLIERAETSYTEVVGEADSTFKRK